MNEAGPGSKYLVLPGKMLQTVMCSFSGLSFSRHGSMTPWPLSARPRFFAYHSFICGGFADLKNIPPMPRIRPFWLMVVFLSGDCTGALLFGLLEALGVCCAWTKLPAAIRLPAAVIARCIICRRDCFLSR